MTERQNQNLRRHFIDANLSAKDNFKMFNKSKWDVDGVDSFFMLSSVQFYEQNPTGIFNLHPLQLI